MANAKNTSAKNTGDDTPVNVFALAKSAPGMNLTNDQWADITNWETLSALLSDTIGEVTSVEEIGSGFRPVDKAELVGKGFIILDIALREAGKDNYGEYSVIKAALFPDPAKGSEQKVEKVVFADGGTGIHEQCKALIRKFNRRGGFSAPNGLRRSDYTYMDDNGKETPATTFYLDESPAA